MKKIFCISFGLILLLSLAVFGLLSCSADEGGESGNSGSHSEIFARKVGGMAIAVCVQIDGVDDLLIPIAEFSADGSKILMTADKDTSKAIVLQQAESENKATYTSTEGSIVVGLDIGNEIDTSERIADFLIIDRSGQHVDMVDKMKTQMQMMYGDVATVFFLLD